MKFRDFEANAKRQMNNIDLKSVSDWEDKFWASLSGEEVHPYGIDNPVSLFPETCKYWNLNKFTSLESLIHNKNIHMSGITDPWLYVGGPLTAFGMHAEDGNLNSINFNHMGAIKVW